MKEELRKRKKFLKTIPRLSLKIVGENAKLDDDGDRIPIFLTDVQNLLLYSVLGHHSPYSPLRWCSLEKFNRVSRSLIILSKFIFFYFFFFFKFKTFYFLAHSNNGTCD